MEPSSRSRCPWTSASCSLHHHHHHHFHPHHHHHYPLVQFPHHHHLICCPHHHVSASFAPLPPQNSEFVGAASLQNLEAEAALLKDDADHGTQMLQEQEEEQQHKGFEEVEEDDDEPIFVLTDEWREFFAKSEAKRKLEKKLKQAKRK